MRILLLTMDELETEGMNDNNGHNLTPVIYQNDFILILVYFLFFNLVCCLLAKIFCSDEFIELMKMLLFFDVLTVMLAKMLIKYVKAEVDIKINVKYNKQSVSK